MPANLRLLSFSNQKIVGFNISIKGKAITTTLNINLHLNEMFPSSKACKCVTITFGVMPNEARAFKNDCGSIFKVLRKFSPG